MSANLIKKFQTKKTLTHLKSHDKEAFIRVYDENAADINRFVYYKIGHREDANDLTSIIFLKTWSHIQNNSLGEGKTLRALLYKIARNAIIDYYREKSLKRAVSLDDENNPLDVADEKHDLVGQLDQDTDLELIKKRLPFLKEEYREVIIMRFVNDLSLEEIADITEKKRGNVRVLLHRALNSLKSLVEESKEKEASNNLENNQADHNYKSL